MLDPRLRQHVVVSHFLDATSRAFAQRQAEIAEQCLISPLEWARYQEALSESERAQLAVFETTLTSNVQVSEFGELDEFLSAVMNSGLHVDDYRIVAALRCYLRDALDDMSEGRLAMARERVLKAHEQATKLVKASRASDQRYSRWKRNAPAQEMARFVERARILADQLATVAA